MTQKIIFELSPDDLKNLFRQELESFFQTKQNPPEQADQIFTVEQAAQFLNLKIPTIYAKVSRNELPFMKQGKRLYFSRADLVQLLKQKRTGTSAEIEVNDLLIKKRGTK